MSGISVKNDSYKRSQKEWFATGLSEFAETLEQHVAADDGSWTIKGFIDVFKNIYTISSDTKVISKILELHLLPQFLDFARIIDFTMELATHQNWYPDMTFISNEDSDIKYAVDFKTTYVNEDNPKMCNGFTLGSHGEYFINRDSSKNIQYPYNQYNGHFCLGIIYSRSVLIAEAESHKYDITELKQIPSVINNFTFFATEKWKIASDKSGSGNTANIGSIKCIADILAGNGTFAVAGEKIFDDYWKNYGKILVENKKGKTKPMTSLNEYIAYRGLPDNIINNVSL